MKPVSVFTFLYDNSFSSLFVTESVFIALFLDIRGVADQQAQLRKITLKILHTTNKAKQQNTGMFQKEQKE